MFECSFCDKMTSTMLGMYLHFIIKHVFTGKLNEEPDQEPMPSLPAEDPD